MGDLRVLKEITKGGHSSAAGTRGLCGAGPKSVRRKRSPGTGTWHIQFPHWSTGLTSSQNGNREGKADAEAGSRGSWGPSGLPVALLTHPRQASQRDPDVPGKADLQEPPA